MFNFLAALVAGLIATAVMSMMMKAVVSMGMTRMPPMPLVLGSMMRGDRAAAMKIGAVMHYLVIGTLALGTIYALLFTVFDSASWVTGGLIGLVHGLVFGAIGLPMMPSIHPRMSPQPSQGDPVEETEQGVVISAPGPFGVHWGRLTAMGVVVLHIVYGVVLAIVYGLLV